MQATARITVRSEYHPDPFNDAAGYTLSVPVAWEGGAIARIDFFFLSRQHNDVPPIGGYLFIGPWLVEVVGIDAPYVYVTRCTAWAWWYAYRWRLAEWYRWTKVRLIATCAVWGLGRYEWSSTASWDDIHLVRRIRQWWKEATDAIR